MLTWLQAAPPALANLMPDSNSLTLSELRELFAPEQMPRIPFQHALEWMRSQVHKSKELYISGQDLSSWKDGPLQLRDLIQCARTLGFQKIHLISHRICPQCLDLIQSLLIPIGGRGPIHDRLYRLNSYKEIMDHLEELKSFGSKIFALTSLEIDPNQLERILSLSQEHEALKAGLALLHKAAQPMGLRKKQSGIRTIYWQNPALLRLN